MARWVRPPVFRHKRSAATYKAPVTIDYPAILPEIEEALKEVGYAK